MAKTIRFVTVALVLGLWARGARAAVPDSFTVQGVLRDSGGALQTMSVQVTVKLFTAQTAGTELASYGPTAVMAQNGLFTLTLVDATLRQKVGAATEVWIEVIAGNDTFPRQVLAAQIYALMAKHAETAASLACSGCIGDTQVGTISAAKITFPALCGGGSFLRGYDATGAVCAAGGTGGVTSITAGTGLTGGTITTSGTIALAFLAAGGANGVASSPARSDHTHPMSCTPPQVMTGISAAGAPICATPPDATRIIRGNINADGTILSGTGFSSTRNGSGIYIITFTTAFSDRPSVSVAWSDNSNLTSGLNGPPTTTGFAVVVTGGAPHSFSFIAAGGP